MALDKVLSTSIAEGAVTAAAISNTANLVVGSISANGAELTSINATSISSGTLDTARLPATANIATAVNVGANVNLTTSSIRVGNSTVNATMAEGKVDFGSRAGVKLDLYSDPTDNYKIEIQPSELRIASGRNGVSNGGITLGKANSSVFTEHARFRNDGRVGIGTDTPLGPVHLKGNAGTGVWGNIVLVLEDNNNDYPGIQFRGTSGELFAVRATPAGGFEIADTSDGANFLVRIGIDSGGRVVTPYQPSFKAGRSGAASYTIGQAVIFNSEFYDIGGHYDASTGIFTAPISGTYLFTATVLIQSSSTSNEYDIVLTTSNASYYGAPGRIEYQLGTSWGDGYIALGAYHLVYMDANDTAYVSFSTFGGGAIYGGATWTNFAGMLIG